MAWTLAAVLAPPGAAESARSLVKKGNEAFEKGNYQEALAFYEAAGEQEPESPAVWFNKGDALYKQGRFAEAADAYEQAAILSDDAWLQARSKFNRGNAEFRRALGEAQADPGRAAETLKRSIRDWRDALRADPGLDDARHNIEVARVFLDRLKRMMQNQPQQGGGRRKRQQNRQQQQAQGRQQSGRDRQQSSGGQQPRRQPAGAEGRRQEAGPRKLQAREKPEDILKEERENRRRRVRAMLRTEPVDKDW